MELHGRDIVCLASSSWDAMWVNAQHLMHRLAADNRILYVNNLGLRAPGRSRGDWSKVRKRLGEWFQGTWQAEENLWVTSPVNIPLHRNTIVRGFNRKALAVALRRQMHALGFTSPILWTFLPLGVELIGELNEAAVVYHCVDDYAANPGVAADELREMEGRLLKRADLVVTTNPVLYDERKAQAKNIVYLGNVANTGHFEDCDQLDTPQELADLQRPIIGYQGNISGYKTDLDLLAFLARSLPEAGIALVGPVGWGDPNTDVSELAAMPNVCLTGRVPYEQLPAYLAAFDVGLLPLRINESTRRSFPMKFYEYMAAGKPIVAADLPAFYDYRERPHLCRLAQTPPEFLDAIKQTLADEVDYRQERIDEAHANSWDVRTKQIRELVADMLSAKAGAS